MTKKLSLYEIDFSIIKPILKSSIELRDLETSQNSCFWLGSVNMKDRERLKTFLSHVNAGDIDKLRAYSDIGGDLIYSVLIKSENKNEYHLLTIQSNKGISLPVILSVNLICNIDISGVKSKESKLDYLPKNFLIEVIKNLFK